jgi:DNA-binding NarL/FixJ family response regulator
MANKSAAGIPHSLVALYDSACRIVWISDPPPPYQRDSVLGREVWVHIPEPNEADRLQAAMLRVLVSLEPQTVDITFPHVGKWRMWLYHVPLNEVRIAEYARRIPPHLTLLTDLEKRICKRLAHGQHTPDIAEAMHVSKSTISAHRSSIARKLNIATDVLVSWCGAHEEWF